MHNEANIFSQLTLLHDLELKELTKGVIVPEGGVKENNIHEVTNPSLLKKASRHFTLARYLPGLILCLSIILSSRSCYPRILPLLVPLRKIATMIRRFEQQLCLQ